MTIEDVKLIELPKFMDPRGNLSFVEQNKHIPFGPYLITGLFIVFTFMDPIRDFLTIIFKGMY